MNFSGIDLKIHFRHYRLRYFANLLFVSYPSLSLIFPIFSFFLPCFPTLHPPRTSPSLSLFRPILLARSSTVYSFFFRAFPPFVFSLSPPVRPPFRLFASIFQPARFEHVIYSLRTLGPRGGGSVQTGNNDLSEERAGVDRSRTCRCENIRGCFSGYSTRAIFLSPLFLPLPSTCSLHRIHSSFCTCSSLSTPTIRFPFCVCVNFPNSQPAVSVFLSAQPLCPPLSPPYIYLSSSTPLRSSFFVPSFHSVFTAPPLPRWFPLVRDRKISGQPRYGGGALFFPVFYFHFVATSLTGNARAFPPRLTRSRGRAPVIPLKTGGKK